MAVNSHDAVLAAYQNLELVRLATAGSVDDGKSTLIGRLLYDCNAIYEDQLFAAHKASKQKGMAELDFSLFTDGLAAEREQQITIDVAYRYFSTPNRRFIVADVPGHEQYTRNMVTGASTADVAIILIDARKGVVSQTKRHLFIASLLQIPHILIVVNKMDEVGYQEKIFNQIEAELVTLAARMNLKDFQFMPVSALKGDMVVKRGDNMPWYQGRTLFDYLENVQIVGDRNLVDFRLPVQLVIRPNQDFRGFAGTVESGAVKVGDDITVLPSGRQSKIKTIYVAERECAEVFSGQAVTLTLQDEIDVSRGNFLVRPGNIPEASNQFEATICWFSHQPLEGGKSYLLKHACLTTRCFIDKLRYNINIDTLHRQQSDSLQLNEIGRVYIKTNSPLVFDPYYKNRSTGNFILIDEISHETVAAGMILQKIRHEFSLQNTSKTILTQGTVLWFTGLPGSGKTTIAELVAGALIKRGVDIEHLDGDVFRKTISKDLGFSKEDRNSNIRRVAEVAKLLIKHNILVLATFVSPHRQQREMVKAMIPNAIEIFVDAPLEICKSRDPKRMYKEALEGKRVDFTGVNQEYEKPENPDLTLFTESDSAEESAERVLKFLYEKGVLV